MEMKFKAVAENYEIAVLSWFYGMTEHEVVNTTWTKEELEKAERYAVEKHFAEDEWL